MISEWSPCKALFLLSLEIIKEMNHKLDYKLIFTYFAKNHDNKRVSGEHLCKFMYNLKKLISALINIVGEHLEL